jgi:hypothetical protein
MRLQIIFRKRVYRVEQAKSQQSFLHAAKAALEMAWDALAVAAGIEPRALKNYLVSRWRNCSLEVLL